MVMSYRVHIDYPPTEDQRKSRGYGTAIDMPEMEYSECGQFLLTAAADAAKRRDTVLYRVWKDGHFHAALLVRDGGIFPRTEPTIPSCIWG